MDANNYVTNLATIMRTRPYHYDSDNRLVILIKTNNEHGILFFLIMLICLANQKSKPEYTNKPNVIL